MQAAPVEMQAILSNQNIEPKIRVSHYGLEFLHPVTYEEWLELGGKVASVAKTSAFLIGDWINYGAEQKEWGEKYTDALKATGFEYDVLRDFATIANRVKTAERSAVLSFQHHRIVAKLEPSEQAHWLNICEQELAQGRMVSTRRLSKSITLGRLADDKDMRKDQAEKGVENYVVLINRLGAWWSANQTKISNATDWQLETLRKDFAFIANIHEKILGMIDARKTA